MFTVIATPAGPGAGTAVATDRSGSEVGEGSRRFRFGTAIARRRRGSAVLLRPGSEFERRLRRRGHERLPPVPAAEVCTPVVEQKPRHVGGEASAQAFRDHDVRLQTDDRTAHEPSSDAVVMPSTRHDTTGVTACSTSRCSCPQESRAHLTGRRNAPPGVDDLRTRAPASVMSGFHLSAFSPPCGATTASPERRTAIHRAGEDRP